MENRTVINIRTPDGSSPVGGQNVNAGGCSFDPLHAGSQGWGQENPDVSGYWYNGDRFVVVWHDRPNNAIKARVFTENVSALSPEITVDSDADPMGQEDAVSPRVHAFSNGFVVVWTRTDNTLWMRSYDVDGIAHGLKQPVTTTSNFKNYAVDIHGTTFACPGKRPGAYFVVTWWDFRDSPWGFSAYYPRYLVFQGVAVPTPIVSGLSYVGLDQPWTMSIPQLQQATLYNRVSAAFAPGCSSDLTIGFTYGLVDHYLGNYDEVRGRFMKFSPTCGESAMGFSGEMPESEACGDSCLTFTPYFHPKEPELAFPPEGM